MARREIAALLEAGKEESARIKVEGVIREDYTVEAYEILELFCDLLLARFGLITEPGDEVDAGIREAVETLIWSASRTDVKEMQTIKEQLIKRFGVDFARSVVSETNETINPRVRHRLTMTTPEPRLVNLYLSEIAKASGIDFDPGLDLEPMVDLYGTGGSSGAPPPGGAAVPGGNVPSADLASLFVPGAGGMGGAPAPAGPYPAATFLDQPVPQMQQPLQPMPVSQPMGGPPPASTGPPGGGGMAFASAEQRAQYEQFLAWQARQPSDSLPAYSPPPSGGGGGGGGYPTSAAAAPVYVAPNDSKSFSGGNPYTQPAQPAPTNNPSYNLNGGGAGGGVNGSSGGGGGGGGGGTALPPGYMLQASGHTPDAPANQQGGSGGNGGVSVNEFGLPSAPSSRPSSGPATPPPPSPGDDDVPDFDDLAARFAALKRR